MSSIDVDQPRAGVRGIARNKQLDQPVRLQFFVIIGNACFEGRELTIDAFEVFAEPVILEDTEKPTLKPGVLTDAKLRIQLYGFVCEIDGEVELVERHKGATETRFRFEIRRIARDGAEALRRIIRSYHAGYVASPADLLEDQDPETDGLPGTAKGLAPGAVSMRRRLLNLVGFGVSIGVIAGTILFVGLAAYEKFFLISASFATVTAPEVKLISAEMGQVRTEISKLGETVNRDTRLYRVMSANLAADKVALMARIAFLNDVVTAFAALPQGAANAKFMAVSGADQAATGFDSMESARRVLRLAEGKFRALQLRIASMTAFSPCDCVVAWYQEDGSWVVPGDTVAVLAKASPDLLRIEALVHVTDMDRMYVGESAVVTDTATGNSYEGAVERITLDPRQQPRVGFPDWLRREPTLGSVIVVVDHPLSADDIGKPFEVDIRKPGLRSWWKNRIAASTAPS